MTTNITEEHSEMLKAIREASNIALFSCYIDGRPGCAIVWITKEDDLFNITPMFVSITAGMKLTDHYGKNLTTGKNDDADKIPSNNRTIRN